MGPYTLKKIFLIVIAITVAIIVAFAVWTITPIFTNTTIDEPIPTSTTIKTSDEVFRVSVGEIQNVDDFSMI